VAKSRRIVVGIVSVIFLILLIMKIDIPRNAFLVLLGIILINQVMDEWNRYRDTKKKLHLIIPITFLAIIIFAIPYLLF